MRLHWPLVVAALLLTSLHCDLNEDDLRCEQAVAHLSDCCPGFDPQQFACASGGCGGSDQRGIEYQDSLCIVSLDCAALQAKGICEWTRRAERFPQSVCR